jgi:hypothetical protein
MRWKKLGNKEVSAAVVATFASGSVSQTSRERNRNLMPASRPVSTPEAHRTDHAEG